MNTITLQVDCSEADAQAAAEACADVLRAAGHTVVNWASSPVPEHSYEVAALDTIADQPFVKTVLADSEAEARALVEGEETDDYKPIITYVTKSFA